MLIDEIEFKADPQGVGAIDEDGWPHNLWRVTLRYGGRSFSTDYRMGIGLVDLKPLTEMQASTRRQRGEDVRWNALEPGKPALATPKAPTLIDVLTSLRSDCQLGDQLFEDFCDDLGYDTDSRRAHATWEACQRMHYELRTLFGYGGYQTFIDTDWEDLECSSS